MQADYLIIGQGICGTFLSKYLSDAGKTVIVADDDRQSSSKISSGVINPVTGRRIVRTWMIEKLMAFAEDAYAEWQSLTGIPVIKKIDVIDFHPSLQMQHAFAERQKQETEFLHSVTLTEKWKPTFNFHYGAGSISPCLLVDVEAILSIWRKTLISKGAFINETFLWKECEYKNKTVKWNNVEADMIVVCNGSWHQEDSPFALLPFANNKGEAIIAEIPGLAREHIYKQSLSIVPWKNERFWIGSTYEWNYQNVSPTPSFKEKVKSQLEYWLKLPFTIVDHVAAERPATIERRPFAGIHPLYRNVAILNGMGTKGCSLAPYFARELADHLTVQAPLDPLANVQRFSRILSSNS